MTVWMGAGDPQHWAKQLALSTPSERSVLAVLALRGEISQTEWERLCLFAGVRDDASQLMVRATFLNSVKQLEGRGLFVQLPGRAVTCPPPVRTLVLREAGARPDFASLVRACSRDQLTDVLAAIVSRHPEAEKRFVAFRKAGAQLGNRIALNLLEPMDAAWLGSLDSGLRGQLLEAALSCVEQSFVDDCSLYPWAASLGPAFEPLPPRALSALAGAAVLRGDLTLLHALLEAPRALALHRLLRVALALIEGRWSEAQALVAEPIAFLRDDHLGVLSLLYWLAVRMRPQSDDRLSALVTLGGKAQSPLQQSFKVAQSIMAGGTAKDLQAIKFAKSVPGDTLTSLWLTMHLGEPPYDGQYTHHLIRTLSDRSTIAQHRDYLWLSEQMALASAAVEQNSKHLELFGFGLPGSRPAKEPLKPSFGPSLLESLVVRPAWEVSLDRLDQLANSVSNTPETNERAGAERIVWRVAAWSGSIEPMLQKRAKQGAWSAGRRLAIKNLIAPSALLDGLPPEDQKVAAFARESRGGGGYYPSVQHTIALAAWRALVGHPRVYLDDHETPIEVVLGQPTIVVEAEGDGVIANLRPERLVAGINIHNQGGKLVVYDVSDELKSINAILASPLKIPAAGKQRALHSLERLAPFVAIQSTEQAAATNAVQADANPTPWLRLTPSQGGLSISLVVRPLGAAGLAVAPGAGAPRLTGRVASETVQVTRDLALELQLVERVISACAPLEGAETGPNRWFIAEPERCLELVAALNALGDAVMVEWPQGSPLRVRAKLGRAALRGNVGFSQGVFSVQASATIDSELSLELAQMLELCALHPGRFVQLASGDYVELEQELREVLGGIAAASSVQSGKSRALQLPAAALSVLDELTSRFEGLALDATARGWRERLDAVWNKTVKLPKTFQGELRAYQLDGFRWLARLADLELGACLADDMGLGKTVQLIALLLHRATSGPALIVAPTSVCENWRRELERFAPSLSVHSYWGSSREQALEALGKRAVVITSYALLQQDDAALQAIEWSTAVLDEGQLIKNADTLRAKAAFGLKAKARIIATGTPVENHAGDIFSLFHFLNPGLLGSWKSFSAAMNEPRSSASRSARRLLQPFVLRRTKTQVLEDLPPLTEIQRTVLMTPGEAKLYESVRKAAFEKLSSVGKSPQAKVQVLAELTRLRRLCCHPELVAPEAGLTSSKLESLLELVEELVASKHRALIFSQFTDVLALIKPLLEKKGIRYQSLDGSSSMKKRSAAVDAFQDGDGDVFLISLKAGGFGLNLTGADYVIHVDPWWNPAVEAQASDRAHRIGQTRPVTVYRLVTAGTIEAAIVELHHKKRDLAESVLSGAEQAASLSADDLRALLG